ncbi:redoxin domain-containing protein [Gilvimarinus sp. F26214L]|uniref:redoxin domain-containing protein n=1 Tax=Gilvimarinus sp. DZF01 TaxID=3461371 RepID=UPI004045E786
MMLAFNASAAPTKIRDFGLIDHQGDQHQITRLGYHSAVVIISQASSCPQNIEMLHKYKWLRTTWEPQGVKFLMLNSSAEDNLETIRKTASTYDIDFPIMHDASQLVAETLDIGKAGEILVIDPRTLQLVFRGPLDKPVPRRRDADAPEPHTPLADALAAVVAGKHSDMDTVVEEVTAESCDLSFPVREMHASKVPDYARDVAPILKENCARCHVEGGIGPFAMNSYEMIRGWAPMMRETIMTKRMPPAQVDPTINHFTNANYLSVEDQQTLIHWIDAGAPRGKSKSDPLHAVQPIEAEWQLGEPDMIVDVPPTEIPATGVLDYFNHVINLDFDKDMYVRAVQFIPGDDRVLHHLLAYITSPESENEVMSEENVRDFLEGYAPGKTDATVFPENTGVFVPKGYNLTMQMHYTTFGKAVVDATRIGLYFHEKKPDYKFLTKPISHGGTALVIPPGAREHRMNFQHVFEHDTMLYAMRPHMHYRGKAFKFSAIYPDGRRETLMNVPNYNFAWQPTYRLSKPIMLPAGTRVVTDGVFDNSQYNPGNPDPSTVVKGGAQSWDEMFIGYFTYTNLEDNANQAQQLSSN